jgi:hypothetical protein
LSVGLGVNLGVKPQAERRSAPPMRDDRADRLRAAWVAELLIEVALAHREAQDAHAASPCSHLSRGTTVASIIEVVSRTTSTDVAAS